MYITLEADYAIRIVYQLAHDNIKIDAKTLAEKTDVPLRFALKILTKLVKSELVISYKGVNGGYLINKPADEISLGEIIEIIDGPIRISRCCGDEYECGRKHSENKLKMCPVHKVFNKISKETSEKLYSQTLNLLFNK